MKKAAASAMLVGLVSVRKKRTLPAGNLLAELHLCLIECRGEA